MSVRHQNPCNQKNTGRQQRRPVYYLHFLSCLDVKTRAGKRLPSTDETDAFLFARLGFRLRLRRKLQHGRRLALAQKGQ